MSTKSHAWDVIVHEMLPRGYKTNILRLSLSEQGKNIFWPGSDIDIRDLYKHYTPMI